MLNSTPKNLFIYAALPFFLTACAGVGDSISDDDADTNAEKPTVSLTASQQQNVPYNGTTTLNWSSSNADYCTASGDWSGKKERSGSYQTKSLTDDSTFTLDCTGPGGISSDLVHIGVDEPVIAVPTVSLTASPSNLSFNGSTTLSWSSSDADMCTASGDWSGSKGLSGSQTISSLTADGSFILNCSGTSGTGSDTVYISVSTLPTKPTVALSASPSSVSFNGSTTLSWSSSNADSCTASGDWSGSKSTTGSQSISSLTADSSYNLNCTGTGGTGSDTVAVSVSAQTPAPTVFLSASPSSVSFNGSTTLSWSSSNADSCTASGDWSGSKSTSGSQSISSLTAHSSYILNCTGTGGTGIDTVAVNVSAQTSTPTVSLSISSPSVSFNGSTTLSWSSTDADSCTASGGWGNSKSTSGSQTIYSLTADRTFILTCSGNGGTGRDSVRVSVSAQTQTPTVSLSASPSNVAINGSTTLSWSSTDADSCTASGDWTGSKSTSGSQSISSLTANSSYILNCTGSGGIANDSVNVTVTLNNTGTALLSWTPPTENTDNSVLTDLAGYKILYGTTSGNYSKTITVNNPGLTSYMVENLYSANWYFAMKAINSEGTESIHSPEVSKRIN